MDTPLHNLAFYGGGSGGGGGGGGGGAAEPERDVNFIDYDGTIVHSYTAEEFAELTALPDNPSHDGLTAQGWNWSLADAKAYVADYGKLWVGQMYITDDGKTRIYIKLEEGRLSPYLGIAVDGSVDVDWGDGSAHDTMTGSGLTTVISTQHTYAAAGEYVIALDVIGSMYLQGTDDLNAGSEVLWNNIISAGNGKLNRVYQSAVQKVEIGSNTNIGNYAFYICPNLESVTIPKDVTMQNNAFWYCYSLKSITIPSGVSRVYSFTFGYCQGLKSIALSKIQTFDYNAFQNCNALTSITLPPNLENLPTTVFQNCSALLNIVIPDQIALIGNQAFQTCQSLSNVTIPNNVTSIGSNVFSDCRGLGFIKFKGLTPPTIRNSNAFQGLPSDCVIYVPRGTLSAYKSATNYPSSSTYTYVEYDP